MVYESDFYTTRRPYRPTPNYSSYTVSSVVPTRQIRILPGLGKVHVVHSYDRIIPYIGHKRLTVVTSNPPHIFRVRPSVIIREIDRIQHKARPYVYYSPTSHYLNSEAKTYDPYYHQFYYPYSINPHMLYNYPYYNKLWREVYWSHLYPKYPTHVWSKYYPYYPYNYSLDYPYYGYYLKHRLNTYPFLNKSWKELYWGRLYDTYSDNFKWSKMFDDETRLIRAQSNSLLRRIHDPVPRIQRTFPVTTIRYNYEPETTWPRKVTSDDFVYRMLTPIRNVKQDIYNISHYHSEPLVRRLVGGGLACVKYGGEKAYSRRRNLTVQECYAMQSDAVRSDINLLSYYIEANKQRKMHEAEKVLQPSRPSRIFSPSSKFIMMEPSDEIKQLREERAQRIAKIRELEDTPIEVDTEARMKREAKRKEEERLAEERALAEENAKKNAQAKKDEAARQAELARQEALAAQAASERAAKLEAAKKEEAAKRAEEERKAAEESRLAAEKEAKEKADRLAKEKAEADRIAKEKAEAERIAKEKEEEEKRLAEEKRLEEERQQLLRLEEIARQAEEEKEKELARQAAELAELARQEAELAEQARREAELSELAKKEAEIAEQERQEKEMADLDRIEREEHTRARDEEAIAEAKMEVEETHAHEAVTSSDEAAHFGTSDEEKSPEEDEPVVEEPVTPDVQPMHTQDTSAEEVISDTDE